MSHSLFPHELQHAGLPCPPLSPKACSNPCPLSRWCHPSILSSVIPFSSCPPSSPASVSFLLSASHQVAKVLGASASASVLLMNIQDWFPLGLTGLISLLYFVLGYKQLTNNVVIFSGEQQRDTAIHVHVSLLSQTPLLSSRPHNIEQSSLCYTGNYTGSLLVIHAIAFLRQLF